MGSLPHFIEQSHILDGDDRLVGEGDDEFDFALRVGNRQAASQREGSYRLAIAHSGTPSMART